jgi:hypothetical protein
MQGLQQGMSMPPLYAGNQVSTRNRFLQLRQRV